MRPLLVLAAALVAAFCVGAASASNPTGLSWNVDHRAFMSWNDLESTGTNTVYNTTGCAWNDMDDIDAYAGGKLASGRSTSFTLCQVTDYGNDSFYPRLIIAQVLSTKVSVTLTDDRGHTWPVNGSICIADPVYTGDTNPADYPPIPGTNGGVGFVTNYTLTITAAKTTQLSAELELAPSHSLGEFGWWRSLSGVSCP